MLKRLRYWWFKLWKGECKECHVILQDVGFDFMICPLCGKKYWSFWRG